MIHASHFFFYLIRNHHLANSQYSFVHPNRNHHFYCCTESVDETDYLASVLDTISSYLVNAKRLVVDFKINFTLFFEAICDAVDNKLVKG